MKPTTARGEEAWKQFSEEIGATYCKGNFGQKDTVQIRYKVWTIILDTYPSAWGPEHDPHWTRMRAAYLSRDGLRFEIYPIGFAAASVFTGTSTWVRLKKFDSGFPDLDAKLRIRANNEQQLKGLLANSRIRQLMNQDNTIHLLARRQRRQFFASSSSGAHELYYDWPSVIVEASRLKSLNQLFAEILDQLCEIGSASAGVPESSIEPDM